MNHEIAVAYARAMCSAQRLEGRLKILFGLHNFAYELKESHGPLTDDEFEALFVAARRDFRCGEKKRGRRRAPPTLGNVVGSVIEKLRELGISALPENVRDALWATVKMRNFVAHHYFEQRKFLFGDQSAWPYLIAELDWFSESFEGWIPSLDKWTDMLLKAWLERARKN